MIDSQWIVLVGFLCCVHCYENLSRKPSTLLTQSTTFQSQGAFLANDGQKSTSYGDCTHTAPNRSSAWLQVDLRKVYTVESVNIYYRNEGSWKPYRFRQYYLDVSNSSAILTTSSQRNRCYTDNSNSQDVPPAIIEMPCKYLARYVIVETTYDAPEDDPTTGAILEICEIEVYGCAANCKNDTCDDYGNCTNGCSEGYWGPSCDSPCIQYCKETTCNIKTGHCISCKSSYWGDICNFMCPIHCSGGNCDKYNGKCNKGCTQGQYGYTCDKTCSPGCEGVACDQQSGTCSAGCKQNMTGRLCDFCDSTHYGSSCSMECSAHCSNITCNNITGLCTFGCQAGFYGEKCDRDCSSCPTGCGNFTGRCFGDCPVGKFGVSCDKACNQGCKDGCMRDSGVCNRCMDGTYGDLCDKSCGTCPTGCDRISGRCRGDCPVGMFGEFCNKTCSQHCRNGCIRLTGSCNDGCTVGKLGDFCNETCDARHEACCNQDTCTRHFKQSQVPNTDNRSSLYVVITVLCISLLVNIITITWTFRNKACKRQDVNQEKKKDTDTISTPGIYDTTEENAGYQELGQLSRPSHYDHLQGPATN